VVYCFVSRYCVLVVCLMCAGGELWLVFLCYL
jgi:hypothetical protein